MPWYAIALGSALTASPYQIIEKRVLLKEHSLFFLATSFFLMLVLSLPMLPAGQVSAISATMFLYILIKCIFAVALFVFCAKAIKHMDISEFGPLMNLSPLVLLIPAVIFLCERLTLVSTAGVLLVVLGAYVVELKDGWRTPFRKAAKDKYVHFIFLAAILSALSATMDKFILAKSAEIGVNTFFFYNRLLIAVLIVGAYFLFRDQKLTDSLKVTLKQSFWWILIASALFMATDYIYFSAVAVPVALVALVIPLKRMSTLVMTVFGGGIFKEDNLIRKTIACLIMIVGVALIVV